MSWSRCPVTHPYPATIPALDSGMRRHLRAVASQSFGGSVWTRWLVTFFVGEQR